MNCINLTVIRASFEGGHPFQGGCSTPGTAASCSLPTATLFSHQKSTTPFISLRRLGSSPFLKGF